MIVKVKKNDKMPPLAYATDGSAGFDIAASDTVVINPGETKLIPTGIFMEIPPNWELQIRPRSGVTLKTKLRIANSPATIDSDFRGEILVLIDHIGLKGDSEPVTITPGYRIAQGVLMPVRRATFVYVDDLSTTDRGDGGFGSTGV